MARKVSISFLCAFFFSNALSSFLLAVLSLYCAGSSGITQKLEMHDQISPVELLRQYCTRFNSLGSTKVTPALPNRKIRASTSRLCLRSHKRNRSPKLLYSGEHHCQFLNMATGIQPLLEQLEANVTNIYRQNNTSHHWKLFKVMSSTSHIRNGRKKWSSSLAPCYCSALSVAWNNTFHLSVAQAELCKL